MVDLRYYVDDESFLYVVGGDCGAGAGKSLWVAEVVGSNFRVGAGGVGATLCGASALSCVGDVAGFNPVAYLAGDVVGGGVLNGGGGVYNHDVGIVTLSGAGAAVGAASYRCHWGNVLNVSWRTLTAGARTCGAH